MPVRVSPAPTRQATPTASTIWNASSTNIGRRNVVASSTSAPRSCNAVTRDGRPK